MGKFRCADASAAVVRILECSGNDRTINKS